MGGLLQVAAMVGAGYGVGIALGWRPIEALFLGAVVSNSSSTVLSKVLGELGETGSVHGRIALAWSSVQDFSTIVLVVVLSAAVGGGDQRLADMPLALGKAVLFLVLLVPVGSVVFPRLLQRVAALRSREVFILAVSALALGVAYASTHFGLALALGAFAAGIVVSESDLWHQVLGEVIPLRDVFAGLFFVSVGMLVSPQFATSHWPLVLLVLALIVLAKGGLSALIALVFRYPLRVAILTGVALAQSAEFSFFLARLGEDMGAISADAFNLMLAGAAASILLAPALNRGAYGVGRRLERALAASRPRAAYAAEESPQLRDHAVICGYGRVGRAIGDALCRHDVRLVVVDHDRQVVQGLREQGVTAFLGSADNPVILNALNLPQARLLVIALPEALATRQIVDYALRVAPNLDIVARTHSESERVFLSRRGVREAVVGELELAFEMIRYALRRFGVGASEVDAFTQGLRARDEGPGCGPP